MKLDHLGVAVRSLDEAIGVYQALGITVSHRETVDSDGVNVAFLPFEGGRFELLEPMAENSPVARFIERRGPGLHHIAIAVPDIGKALADIKGRGLRLIDAEPRPGANGSLVAFVHPEATGGVLLELVQPGDSIRE